MKRAGIVLLIAGAAVIVLSLLLTFVMLAGAQQSGSVGIIGGAGAPAFWLLYSQSFYSVGTGGAVACIAGAILLIIKK